MSIKYKVVTLARKSAIVTKSKHFCLTYNKGSVVKCVDGTCGIMVFDTLENAQDFASEHSKLQGQFLIILKVKPKGRKRVIKTIKYTKLIAYSKKDVLATIKRNGDSFLVPKGTECYSEVLVLD